MKKLIQFQPEIRDACPQLTCGVIQCSVSNSAFNQDLWELISQTSQAIREERQIQDVKHIPTIAATREAYKSCGKDPNRYRPSAEQLNRRILQGKELYQISTLVDLVNLVSVKSGYSIGGFDAQNIVGNISYGIGKANEPYKGIGRGELNIEGLPILRDEVSGIGTPTSDEERTMLNDHTQHFLMNINAYNGKNELLDETIEWSVELLQKFVAAKDISIDYFA